MALKEYGDLLKKIRKSAGLSQVELSHKISIDQGMISRLEKNERRPNLDYLSKFAQVFDLQLDYLINGNVNFHAIAQKFNQDLPVIDRYKKNVDSYVREILPFIHYVNKEKGPDKVKEVLSKLGLESLVFLGPNEKISTFAVLDIIDHFVKKKYFNKASIIKIAKQSHSNELHGNLYQLFNEVESAADVLNLWALQSKSYDSLYHYDVVRNEKAISLKAKIKLGPKDLEGINKNVLELYAVYRTAYLQELPKIIGRGKGSTKIKGQLPTVTQVVGELSFQNVA